MKKKIALMVTSLVLVVAMAVGGTLAYMSHTTQSVENTFTVGSVAITLDEAKVNTAGEKVDADGTVNQNSTARVTEGNEYRLFPGRTYVKDPTVHVTANSEPCYVFVKVENGISDYEVTGEGSIASQIDDSWTLVTGETNIYYYNTLVPTSSSVQDLVVFEQFTINSGLGNADFEQFGTPVITIVAYAIQADTFDNANAAWAAAPSNWTASAP